MSRVSLQTRLGKLLILLALLLFRIPTDRSAFAYADLSDQELIDHLRVFITSDDPAARQNALKTLSSLGAPGVPRLESALGKGLVYTPQPTGVTDRKAHLDVLNADFDYVVCVPDDYKPDRSYPLLVAMHGTSGTGRGFYDRWYRHVKGQEVILVAPTSETPQRTKGYGATEPERQVPLAVIRDVRKYYHVDSNRVYLTGVSMGGHATWDNLLSYTDHYAAGIIEAGAPMVEGFQVARSLFYPNLGSTGIYIMQGTPDHDAPEMNRDAVAQLKRLCTDAVYVEFPGAGHGSYEAGSYDALAWLWPHKRQSWPGKVNRVGHRLCQARAWWWVRVDEMKGSEWDPRARTVVHADPKTPKEELIRLADKEIDKALIHVKAEVQAGNRIVITCSHVSKLTVRLHPDLVDFSKPVCILVNGQTAFLGRVQPDPAALLNAVAEDFDFQRLPYASITMPVR